MMTFFFALIFFITANQLVGKLTVLKSINENTMQKCHRNNFTMPTLKFAQLILVPEL